MIGCKQTHTVTHTATHTVTHTVTYTVTHIRNKHTHTHRRSLIIELMALCRI